MKGLPHGPAAFEYKDPSWPHNSFTGVGVFNHGQLHNTPFTCLKGDGYGRSFSNMQNGKYADGCYYTGFSLDGSEQNVDSKQTGTDVSGW